ncbi:MAG: methyltransferase domain-containing protein [Actinomycetota bacterium]|nr:methyltransferase domain-containing protein [Actinomycetota bacterium]
MATDSETLRAEMLERWEQAAGGWGRRAQRVREMGMPVSAWMIEHLALGPGQRLLELAAGPGDTGFMAAELIEPGGQLICSDAAEEMLAVARERARELGVTNVEFKRLELEWIDLSAADVDRVLCRWGVMLVVDPSAALREIRRVLRPGGRVALAVWDAAERNPWITLTARAVVELGHAPPPDPTAPGPFALSDEGVLEGMLADAGFTDVRVDAVGLMREYEDVTHYIAEQLDLSRVFVDAHAKLPTEEWDRVTARVAELAESHMSADGRLQLAGRSLVAIADA